MLRTPIFAFLIILFHIIYVFAGTTGKIAGQVKDKKTGEPLVGVNVVVEGYMIGAAADLEGYYFILNLFPGKYTIKAMMAGYKTQIVKDVKVSADLTTIVNFDLTEDILEGEAIVVVAEKPLIQRDETSKATVIESEVFEEMPISSFEGALTTQAGFTTDEDGDMHVRGGREGEVAYMIDGVYVRDPYSGGFNSQLDKYAIEELQVLTGGFTAEYGQAMSGVINVVTKEGGKEYHGRFEYESPQLNKSPYQREDWMLYTDIVDGLSEEEKLEYKDEKNYEPLDHSIKGTPEYMPVLGNFSANFNGPVPFIDNFTFFTSGRYYNSKGYLPTGYNKKRELNFKVTYSLSSVKLNIFVQRNLREWQPYYHKWKYNPEGYEDRKRQVEREGIIITHVLSNATYYEARFSRFSQKYDRYQPGKWAEFAFNDSLNIYELIDSNFEQGKSSEDFYYKGDYGRLDDKDILTFTGKVDLISQVNRMNLVKLGVEIVSHKIYREYYQKPWPLENHRYEKFTRYPIEAAIYLQNKLEHNNFVLNLGLRYDYSDPEHTIWTDLNMPGYYDENDQWIPSDEVSAKPKTQISPRLGIGFPITDKTLFYSSYGHFYQIPDYSSMYGPHEVVHDDRALIGNPTINPQKTVAFEAGVRQQIGEDYVLDFNIYFKDITNLAGSTFHGFFPHNYTIYDNSDYASVNGIDITIKKRLSHNYRASLNYSYSIAKGNESSPDEGYDKYRHASAAKRPKRVFYLDFDRRHDLSFNMNIKLPKKFGPKCSGIRPFGDIRFNILFEAASGLPYTPNVEDESSGIDVEKNSGRLPAVYNLDLKIQKRIKISVIRLTGFVTIKNVFDRRNVREVWSRTGLPWDNGQYSTYSNDRIYDPENVLAPRRIYAGLRLDF